MTAEKKHVVRFTSPVSWRCTCGWGQATADTLSPLAEDYDAVERAHSGAEQHAFDNHGRIEMGRAS
jgi:hypothetical protein